MENTITRDVANKGYRYLLTCTIRFYLVIIRIGLKAFEKFSIQGLNPAVALNYFKKMTVVAVQHLNLFHKRTDSKIQDNIYIATR